MDLSVLVPYIWPVILGFVALTVFQMWLLPIYNVWASRKAGEADLAKANAEAAIVTAKANAQKDAAKHYAEADYIRAQGIAKAITEMEDKLGGPENYLKWKYIHFLEQQGSVNQIIYVPTEAGMPIFEAGKRPDKPPKSPLVKMNEG